MSRPPPVQGKPKTPTGTNRVRVLLTPPDHGEPLSLWGTATPDRTTITLDVLAAAVQPGWAVSDGRGLTGHVKAVAEQTLTIEVTP